MRRIRPAEPRIRTFSMSFPGDPIDETEYARIVCNAAKAENHVVRVTADEFWRDLPTLVRCQQEPFSLSFVYAHWRLMKCASEHDVRVILEGHGGDELLCGYTGYYFYYFMTLFGQRRLHRLLIEALLSRDLTETETKRLVKTYLPTIAPFVASLVTRILKARKSTLHRNCASDQEGGFNRVLTADLAAKLEIDVLLESLPTALRHVEMNSAWHSVEVRLPFLEKVFAEHCASLPLDQKIRNGWTKYAFRLAMKDILPEQIRLRRRKIGFQMPIDRWIENELRQRLRAFFSDSNLRGTRYYSKETAESILNRPALTDRDTRLIWSMLNLELWLREFFSTPKDKSGETWRKDVIRRILDDNQFFPRMRGIHH
jgi:asparagine synthase (glutamine-hydrolysing)